MLGPKLFSDDEDGDNDSSEDDDSGMQELTYDEAVSEGFLTEHDDDDD